MSNTTYVLTGTFTPVHAVSFRRNAWEQVVAHAGKPDGYATACAAIDALPIEQRGSIIGRGMLSWVLRKRYIKFKSELEENTSALDIDDINARLFVTARFCVTLGLYAGPITKAVIAENIDSLIETAGGIEDFIDSVELEEIIDDTDAPLIFTMGETKT